MHFPIYIHNQIKFCASLYTYILCAEFNFLFVCLLCVCVWLYLLCVKVSELRALIRFDRKSCGIKQSPQHSQVNSQNIIVIHWFNIVIILSRSKNKNFLTLTFFIENCKQFLDKFSLNLHFQKNLYYWILFLQNIL